MSNEKIIRRIPVQRSRRKAEGWKKVELWVPSERDAETLRNLGASMRAQAGTLSRLSDEIPAVTPGRAADLAAAVQTSGASAFTKTDGAVNRFMTALSDAGAFSDYARAFAIIANAYPVHAVRLEGMIGRKVSHHLIRFRGVARKRLDCWKRTHPD